MASELLTSKIITRKALRVLHQKLNFIGGLNRQYDKKFAVEGGKVGDTILIRKPFRPIVRDGRTVQIQDAKETSIPLKLEFQTGADLAFTSADLTLNIDDFSERFIDPAMAVVASTVEARVIAGLMPRIYNKVGTPGTAPITLKTYTDAGALLDNNLAPRDNNRNVILSPEVQSGLVDNLKGLFQDSTAISKQYREGLMGRTAGFDFWTNTLMPTLLTSSNVSGLSVNGAGQQGATLQLTGSASGQIYRAGHVFTIAGVYAVHPETKSTQQRLQQFIVTTDTVASGTTVSLPISPAIAISGGEQNVSSAPANSAPITFAGAANTGYQEQIAFHRDFAAFATADLILPKGMDMASRETFDGISLRFIRGYDINNDVFVSRMDILWGYQLLRPELATRITA